MNYAILLPAQVLWQALPSCATASQCNDRCCQLLAGGLDFPLHSLFHFSAVVLANFKQSHSVSFGKGFVHLVLQGIFFYPITDVRWVSQLRRLR